MNPKIVNDLNQIAEEMKARIQAYADLHNISFEEAKKRARININGKSYRIDEVENETQNGVGNGSRES